MERRARIARRLSRSAGWIVLTECEVIRETVGPGAPVARPVSDPVALRLAILRKLGLLER